MVDQNTALWIFAIAMIAVIVWSDGRRFLQQRAEAKAKQAIEAFFESRTRFTIREAACIAVGVHPSDFAESTAAQSEANEMLYYTRKALILPAAMNERQHTALRQGRNDHGFDLDGVSLDTFITKDELASYIRPGSRSWLPVLDRLNNTRS